MHASGSTLLFYDLCRFRKQPTWRLDRKTLFRIYALFFLTFLLFNPAILSPEVWKYGWQQFTHQRMTHHGYYMMGRLYLNSAMYTVWGEPVWYFPLYMFVKMPPALLAFFIAGLIFTLSRWKDDRFLFLGLYFVVWNFLLALSGGKFTRYAMTFWPIVILMQALGLYIFFSAIQSFLEKRNASLAAGRALLMPLLLLICGWSLYLDFSYSPDYPLYVSSLAGGKSKLGYYFPPDDFYDAGLREGIQYICRTAPPHASVLGTTRAAFSFYQQKYNRNDLNFVSMAEPKLNLDSTTGAYIIFQDYRRYLENDYILTFAYSELKPLFVSEVKGIPSVVIYFLSKQASYARAPFWKAKRWPGRLSSLTDGGYQ